MAAYTTDGALVSEFKVELSTDGTIWTDVSGDAQTVTTGGGERGSEETMTGGADAPIVSVGKLSAQTVECNFIYRGSLASSGFKVARDALEAGTPLHLRYTPLGGPSTNRLRYVSASAANVAAPGLILSCPIPEADAGATGIMMAGFSMIMPRLKSEAVT